MATEWTEAVWLASDWLADAWLASDRLGNMVDLLRRRHDICRTRRGRRKLRLFAVALCRSFTGHLPIYEPVRECLDVAERAADGEADRGELFRKWTTHYGTPEGADVIFAEKAIVETTREPVIDAVRWTLSYLRHGKKRDGSSLTFADIGRHVFGNPFRPPEIEPAMLSWKNETLAKMARMIYDERRFTDMPLLADALEEAGCVDTTVLNHCREPGEHARGCWVVDLLLGLDYRKGTASQDG